MKRAAIVRATTRLAAAALPLVLVACASTPRKSASEAIALPDRGRVHGSALPHSGRKRSPYAAAQEDPRKRGNYTAGGLYAPGVADGIPDFIPDVDAIPEPEVVAEERSAYGNRSPYVVLGKTYKVLDEHDDYVERGTASFYGTKFHGRRTSNLEVYDMLAFTAAHKSLPLPSFARVTNLENGKSVTVRVNDRGPFHDGRLIDLSYAAAVKLGITQRGTGQVEVRALHPGDQGTLYAKASSKSADSKATDSKAAAIKPAGKPAPTAMDRLVSAMPIASASAAELPPGVRIATGKPTRLDPASGKPVVETAAVTKPTPVPASPTVVATAAPAATPAGKPLPGQDYRFDMLQNGKPMSADEFDVWMKSRQVRVATGKGVQLEPPKPLTKAEKRELAKREKEAARARELAAKNAKSAAPVVASAEPAKAPLSPPIAAQAPPPPSPEKAATVIAAATPSKGDVTLQVASFSARGNADRALSMLRGAGIDGARVLDGNAANGQKVWRLRVGPLAATAAPELAARLVGLGFGQPQRVRD